MIIDIINIFSKVIIKLVFTKYLCIPSQGILSIQTLLRTDENYGDRVYKSSLVVLRISQSVGRWFKYLSLRTPYDIFLSS